MIILLVIILVLIKTTPLIEAEFYSGVLDNNIDSKTKGNNIFLFEGRRRRVGKFCDNYIIILLHWDQL